MHKRWEIHRIRPPPQKISLLLFLMMLCFLRQDHESQLRSALGLYEQPYAITLTILFSAVAFFGVFLNSIIVFTVYRCPEMRNPCNLLIVNIAVSDLAVASLAAPLRIIEVVRWMAVWRIFVPPSRSDARFIRYCVSCFSHNHSVGEVSCHRTSLEKANVPTRYQVCHNLHMACLLYYSFSTHCSYLENARVQRHSLVHGRMAFRSLSNGIRSVSSRCLHCNSFLHTIHGLF